MTTLISVLGTGCAPDLRPNSNAFTAGNPITTIEINEANSPESSGPSVADRAAEIDYGPWDREKVNSDFSKTVTNLYAGEIQWDSAQRLFRLQVNVSLQNGNEKEVSLPFSFVFNRASLNQTISAKSADRLYSLEMTCASNSCNEKVFRLKRQQDGAVALIKNIRSDEVLVTNTPTKSEIPVVQHYTEVKEGRAPRRQVTDRNGSSRDLETYLSNPDLLKKMRLRNAIDVPALTEKTAPGITKMSMSERIAWVAEAMIRDKTYIPSNACNKFVLWVLAAAGYRISSEPVADDFLNLLADRQFNDWKVEVYNYKNRGRNDEHKLNQRLMKLPERYGVIFQYGRGSKAHGHVAIVSREGSKFYVMDASLNKRAPRKRAQRVDQLLNASRSQLHIMIPPGAK